MKEYMPKPPHGSPCNGCGACCIDETCPLGEVVFRSTEGPCPALTPLGLKFTCGLVVNTEAFAPEIVKEHGREKASQAAFQLIGANLGCDAQSVNEPRNSDWMNKVNSEVDWEKVNEAREIWKI